MKTFTTDLATYEIQPETGCRVDAFDTDGQPIWEEYTTFRIFKDGKLLSVAYDEDDIPMVINCQEQPERYAGMNSRFD